MLRIGICDDISEARMTLRAALERALVRRRMEGSFYEFSSGEGLLRWLERHIGELDLVFLDVRMGGLDGMDTARRLHESDENLRLVFVTAYDDYVFDGYSVGALGYLLKPPRPEQLDDVLDRAASVLLPDQNFLCRSGETIYRIPKKKIRYFYSERRRIVCVAEARTYVFYGKLDETARETGSGFVRIHQRYLVRAGAVERVEGSLVFVGDEALPISRACRPAALAALARAVLEE
ncbi:MAG: LytTR family DNA-binding domain-containing protein [Oscillospiraceae bacterium]|nr:LytTR family DNA-binding domain-containing protein [Oscillospiraceae bacterium]